MGWDGLIAGSTGLFDLKIVIYAQIYPMVIKVGPQYCLVSCFTKIFAFEGESEKDLNSIFQCVETLTEQQVSGPDDTFRY